MDNNMFTVSRIFDDDYGCEERDFGEAGMAIVILKDKFGEEREIKVADDFLIQNGIEEGSVLKWRL